MGDEAGDDGERGEIEWLRERVCVCALPLGVLKDGNQRKAETGSGLSVKLTAFMVMSVRWSARQGGTYPDHHRATEEEVFELIGVAATQAREAK